MQKKIDTAKRQGIELTRGAAVAEVVADTSEMMLSHTKAFKHLAQQDKTLFGKIKEFVNDLYTKIRNALKGVTADHPEAKALIEAERYVGQLQQAWDNALVEAMETAKGVKTQTTDSATQTPEGTTVSEQGQFRIREVDGQKIVWVDTDILEGKPQSQSNVSYIKDYLIDHINDVYTIIESGNKVFPAKRLPSEYLHSKSAQNLAKYSRTKFNAKLHMVSGIGEMIEIATNRRWEKTRHTHNKNAEYGIYRYDTKIAFAGASSVKAYNAELIILNSGDGKKYLYDIVNIKNDLIAAKSLTKQGRGEVKTSQQTNEVNNNVSYTDGFVNPSEQNFSLREQDYQAAVQNGNTSEAQQLVDEAAEESMPNSKIRSRTGKLLKVYHGTNAEFTVFDTSKQGGVNGTNEGYGIYLSDSQEVTGAYGTRQIAAYANITRPATSFKKTITQAQLVKLIKDTCQRQAKQMVADDEYDSVRDAVKDTWISNYADTYSTTIDAAYREVASSILRTNSSDMDVVQEVMGGMAIRSYADAEEFYRESLTPITGFDGFWTTWNNDATGKKQNIILAFDSSQIKSAAPVTYDDNGNVIPLSERFNTEEKDIRYSLRDYNLTSISDDDLNNITSRGNEVVYSRSQLEHHIDNALNSNAQKTIFIGNIDSALKNRLETETGVTLFRKNLDYAYGVSYDCIRHIRKHFTSTAEIADAVQFVFSMLNNHDAIEPIKRKDGGYNLRIRKGFDVIELEAIAETSKRTRGLTVKTAYISRTYKKGATIRQADTSNVNGAPRLDRASSSSINASDKNSNPSGRIFSLRNADSDLTRQYLGNMQPTSDMTDSEKWLLDKYQKTLKELQERETEISSQLTLAQNAQTDDDRLKAQNRAAILQKQADRLRRELRKAEGAKGFATLMHTSEKVVDRFLHSETGNNAFEVEENLNQELDKVSEQLKATEQRIRETESVQQTAMARSLFNQAALNKSGNDIRKAFDTRMSGKEIGNRVALAFAELNANPGNAKAWETFIQILNDLASDILKTSRYSYKSQILQDLRENLEGHFSLSEAQKQELKHNGITLTEFKRMMKPVATVSDGGTTLSAIISTADYYGQGIIAQLQSSDSEGDLVMKLYDLVSNERLQESNNVLEGMTEEESIRYIMAEIVDKSNLSGAIPGESDALLRNALMKGTEGNEEISAHMREALDHMQKARSKTSQIWHKTVEAEATAKKVLDYYRAIDEQRRLIEEKEIIQQLKSEAIQKLREEREARELSEKAASKQRHIKRVVSRLNDIRTNETDYRNIPEHLKAFVDDVVREFTDGFGSTVFSAKQADRLRTLYAALQQQDEGTSVAYDSDMQDTLDALHEWAERYQQVKTGSGMKRTERTQLRSLMMDAVSDLVDNVYAMVRNEQNIFIAGRRQQFASIAAHTRTELEEHADHLTFKGRLGEAERLMDNLLRTGNLTPMYFFDRLGNRTLKNMYQDMARGMNIFAFRSRAAQNRLAEIRNTYDYDSWHKAPELAMKTEQGHEITLTKEQALWLYATWRREHSNPIAATEHLTKGGFVYEGNNETTVDSKNPFKRTQRTNTTGHRISEKDMAAVNNYLTVQEKAYADAVISFLSNDVAEWGNEASMEMFGIRKYKENYYFPYATVRDQLHQDSTSTSAATADDSRLKHASFTHALTRGARTTLVMGDFSTVAENHIGQMANYSGLVLPIENFNRILNYRFETEDGSRTTMRSLIRQKYGSNTLNYMETLLRDVNGGVRSAPRSPMEKAVSLFKKSAVVSSLSVSFQQPSAILRAMAVMDPKYILPASLTMATGRKAYKEALEYSGTAIIKQMGRFDTNVGQTYVEWLHNPDESNLRWWEKVREAVNPKEWDAFKDRWTAIATGLPNIMDEVAWGALWRAVKAEQADLHPDMDVNSREFLDICGTRFDDVTTRTQVFDSVLTRSQLMRSKNMLDQMATAFKAEPTLTLNVLYDAFTNKNIPNGQRKKRIASALAATVTSSIAAAIGSAVISAWSGDDDDRTAAEKLLGKTSEQFWGNILPWNNMPYVSDIVSIFEGYDVERADMSLISDLYQGYQRVLDWNDPAKEHSFEKGWRMVEDFGGTIANFLGVPTKNIMRDMVKEKKKPEDGESKQYTQAEIAALLSAMETGALTRNALRDTAMVALALGSGLRAFELCSLNVSHLSDIQKGTIDVERKGGGWSEVSVSDFVYPHIARYLLTRRGAQPDEPLFLSQKGNRMTPNTLWKTLAYKEKQLGMKTGVHIFRHTFLSDVERDQKGGAALARDLAGHKSVRMEASEFVVTMLVANLAAVPMDDSSIPLISGLVPILTVLGMELILSFLIVKSVAVRKFLCGKPVILIDNGKIIQQNLRSTRVTTDELTSHLRLKDVLDLNTVQYAILETSGNLSVFLYPEYMPASARDANVKAGKQSLPITIINDGKLSAEDLERAGKNMTWLQNTLKAHNAHQEDTLLLTVNEEDAAVWIGKSED